MLILGIDPGYDRLGVALTRRVGSKDELVFSTCISPAKKNIKKNDGSLTNLDLNDNLSERYVQAANELQKIIDDYKPEVAAIEELFIFKNQKTVIKVAEMIGVIKFVILSNKLKLISITPAQIKVSLTGNGKADKKMVDFMVRKILKIDLNKKIIDDEVDAIAIALTGALFHVKKL